MILRFIRVAFTVRNVSQDIVRLGVRAVDRSILQHRSLGRVVLTRSELVLSKEHGAHRIPRIRFQNLIDLPASPVRVAFEKTRSQFGGYIKVRSEEHTSEL